MDELGTILSIWAHPDDETYLAGGVMARARERGMRVVCALATAGELGTDDPQGWPPDRLGPLRRREAAAAMAALGVTELEIQPFPDGGLGDHSATGVEWAGDLLERVEPDTILTFGADGATFHPDHIAVHRWVTTAWRRRGSRGRLLYAATTVDHLTRFGDEYEAWGIYMTDERPVATNPDELALHLRLDGHLLERKLSALRALSSQTAETMAALGPGLYAELIAEEAFIAADRGAPSPR